MKNLLSIVLSVIVYTATGYNQMGGKDLGRDRGQRPERYSLRRGV